MADIPQHAVADIVDADGARAILVEHLVAKLRTLDELEQIILSLFYEQELNIEEISAVMGMSKTKVSDIFEAMLLNISTELNLK